MSTNVPICSLLYVLVCHIYYFVESSQLMFVDSQPIDRQAKFSSAANGPVSPLFKASSDLQLNRQRKREMKKVGRKEEGIHVKE